jgi:TPR repeat protein
VALYREREINHGETNGGGSKTLVDFDTLLHLVALDLPADDYAAILAADQGVPEGECEFGLWLLEHGRDALAVRWLRRAAQGGVADAMQWLGKLYAAGQGVAQDDAHAIEWIKLAAAHGHVIARRQVDELGL